MPAATSLVELILKKWGDDIAGAAKELEQKIGFPESVANRIATGELPMDAESVAARRIEQGYGDTPQYHATDSDFVEFRPSARGKMGRGVYTSPDTGYVGKYTPERSGANVKEVYLRGDRVKRHEQSDIYPDYFSGGMSEDEMIDTMAGDGVRHVDGYSGDTLLETSTPNPSDIRSSGAAFDPQYKGSNIMGGLALPAAAGLLAAGQSEDADAGPLSKAAKIAALRAEANAARFGDEIDVSYRGDHVAPTAEYGAPLHNLTDMIPEDVYGPSGPRLYGVGDTSVDNEAFEVLRAVRGNPDAEVTMYRAVPNDAPDAIADGDWVTTSRTYAEQHGERALDGDYKILEEPTYARRLQSEGYPYEFGYMENGNADPRLLAGTAAGTAGLLAAPMVKDSGMISAPRSETLFDLTMGARDIERRLEGSLASLLFPSGLVDYLETVNRREEDPNAMTRGMALLDVLPW